MTKAVYVYNPKNYTRNTLSKKVKKFTGLLFLLLLIGAAAFSAYLFATQNGKAVTSPLNILKQIKKEPPPPPKRTPDEAKKQELIAKITQDLGPNKDFRVAINDIELNDTFGIRQDEPMHAASVIKTLVATTLLTDIEAGKYTLEEPLGSYTVDYQLQQMINQSNNTSWDLINSLLGWPSREQKEADDLGLVGVDVYYNLAPTKAISDLLYKIYTGKVLTKSHRDLLLGYMTNTNKEDRIPAGLPSGTKVYHKWGAYNAEIHDAAIVEAKHPFTLVIFTDGGTSYEARVKAIQAAATDVYAYFDTL